VARGGDVALEIERKFLVSKASIPPDAEWPVPFTDYHIVQCYLDPLDKRVSSERVRVTIPTDRGSPRWTHTKKIRVSEGIHKEQERSIGKGSYTRMLKRATTGMVPVQKMRRVFYWLDRKFELDIFEQPFEPLVMLEIELASEDEFHRPPVLKGDSWDSTGAAFTLPTFLKIDADVTSDRSLTNAALARKGHWP
jgi:CYTH domain-containing protein